MNERYCKLAALGTIAALLAACGGGGGNAPLPVSKPIPVFQTTQTKLTFQLGAVSTTASRRSPKYISRNTNGIGIRVRPNGGSFSGSAATPGAGNTAADVSLGSANCITGASPARTCTVLIAAPVGYDDFEITAWDTPPSGGTFSGNQISNVIVTNQLVQMNALNTIPFTMNGVVAGVALSVSPSSLVSGTASAGTLTVLARDADGNIIIGSPGDTYTDSSGNPVTITVSATPACSLGVPVCSTLGNTTLGTTSFTGPSTTTSTVTYDGGPLTSSTFAVTAPSLVGNSSATLNFTASTGGISIPGTPLITMFTPSGHFSATAIASGPDGNIWFQDTSNGLTKMSTSGSVLSKYPVLPGGNNIRGFTAGADNAMWAFNTGNNKIERIPLNMPPYAPGYATLGSTVGGSLSSATYYVVETFVSPDGETQAGFEASRFVAANNVLTASSPAASGNATGYNIYVSTSSGAETLQNAAPIALGTPWTEPATGLVAGVAKPTVTTMVSQYTIPTAGAGVNLGGMTVGPDGNVWFVEQYKDKIGKITASGNITEYALPAFSGGVCVASGSDGNLWVTAASVNKILRVTTAGVVTTMTPTTGAGLFGITSGRDGNLWFTEYTAQKIGKMTTAGVLSEYTVPGGNNGIGIAAGADGNIYFATYTPAIGRVTPTGLVSLYTNGITPGTVIPDWLTAGSDNNIWFTDGSGGGGLIGRVAP